MRPAWLLASAFVSGCASAPAGPPRAPTPSTQIATVTDAETVAPSPKSRVWGLLDQRAPIFGYIDGQRFVASPVARAIIAALPQMRNDESGSTDLLAELNRTCGFDPSKAVRELTFAADPSTGDLTAVIALDVQPDLALACMGQLWSGLESVTLAGRTALCEPGFVTFPTEGGAEQPAPDRLCLAPHENLLVMSSSSRLESLLARFPAPRGVPPSNDYFLVTGEFPNPLGVKRATFSLSDGETSGTRLRLEARTGSREQAANLEAQARQVLAALPERAGQAPPDLRALFSHYLEKIELGHRGNTAHATLTAENAMLAGLLSGLAAYGVKHYLTEAKADAARAVMTDIAVQLVTYANDQPSPRFPPSAPPVPSAVPAGTQYTSTVADWAHKSWSVIDFDREGPQYHSFEYVTSRNGKRATVRARGDLDGDGVMSLFEMDVVIEGNEARRVPGLRETNPHE